METLRQPFSPPQINVGSPVCGLGQPPNLNSPFFGCCLNLGNTACSQSAVIALFRERKPGSRTREGVGDS